MEERQIKVKEYNKLLKIICWIIAGIFFVFGLLMVCIEPKEEYIITYIITFLIGIIFLSSVCFPHYIVLMLIFILPQKCIEPKREK